MPEKPRCNPHIAMGASDQVEVGEDINRFDARTVQSIARNRSRASLMAWRRETTMISRLSGYQDRESDIRESL